MFKTLPASLPGYGTHYTEPFSLRFFLIIARQFVFSPQVIASPVCRLVTCAFMVVIWLTSHNAFADSATQTSAHTATNSQPKAGARPLSITDADCIDFINQKPARVRCGFIDLPVNHDEPDKGTVTLPVLIARQTQSLSDKASDKAILIPGGGGPGASIGFGEPYLEGEYLGYYNSLRAAGFDIVILDQRGAGFAKPALRCAETSTAFIEAVDSNLSFKDALNLYHESLSTCRERLINRQIPLEDFDTWQSAQDFLAVIQHLPYNWWGTLATSYATVIAQVMEIAKPQVFDRIVLDSPVSIDFQQPFTFELTEDAVERVLSLCEITSRCTRRHSDIKSKFQQVLERARQNPYSVSIEHSKTGSEAQNAELHIDDITLLDMLMQSAYSNYTLIEIPWAIDELYKNKPHKLQLIATDYWHYNSDPSFGTALSWAIHCKERQPLEAAYLRLNPQESDSYSNKSKIAIEQESIICNEWNLPASNIATPDKPFTTKTLIIGGDLDPVISREDIKNTADNFSNKKIMILPGMGHSVWFQSECTRNNTVSFFKSQANHTLAECKDGITRFR